MHKEGRLCLSKDLWHKKSATNVNHRESPLHALLILLTMVIDNVHWILMNDFSIPTHWFLHRISRRMRHMRFFSFFQRPICLVVCFNKSFLDGLDVFNLKKKPMDLAAKNSITSKQQLLLLIKNNNEKNVIKHDNM